MQAAPTVHVTLAPSRVTLVAVAVAAAATIAVVLTLPLPSAALVFAVFAVLAWAVERGLVVALRRSRRAIRSFDLGAGLDLCVHYGDGSVRAGRVDAASCVTQFVTTIVWRPERLLAPRSILILPDMLPAEDFRRLRVLLRYERSESTHGAPPSHA